MEFHFYSQELANTSLLSVDGICPTGPNLSHWPGNRTPPALKHDLSTGILLRYAALPKKERLAYLDGIELVSNNHYDTDGLLSLWIALNPEKALRFSKPLLEAAEAGDFSLAPSADAVKFDLIVSRFADPTFSPIGLELWNLNDEQRYERSYQILLDLLPGLFDRLDDYASLWREPFARFEESHEYLKKSATIRRFPEIDLTVIEADRDLDARALQTAAQADRVLFVQHQAQGQLYHFWYAVTSWFELVTTRKPLRVPLRQIATLLNRDCPGEQGRWIGEDIDVPIAHLFFGETSKKVNFLDLPGRLLPHPMRVQKIESSLIEALTNSSHS